MEITFNYIRNRIGEYRKDELLEYCYNLLDENENKIFPVWYIFTIMKWSYLYGEKKYPPKNLNKESFGKIYNAVSNFNQEHISNFIHNKKIYKAFQVLHAQQFYLQKWVSSKTFATQLKLFCSINGKYDIKNSFFKLTGFTIQEFLFIEQLFWLYINIEKLGKPNLYFDGFLDKDFIQIINEVSNNKNLNFFLNLLTLHPKKTTESISNFKHKINKNELQTMEMSFFTMFPFQVYNKRIRLIHKSIFNHTCNYYIYDLLKSYDSNFTTEFGNRLEKYIEFGLKEIKCTYKKEKELKKFLPENSNLVDYYIEEYNVFIECKATEIQAYASVNPTDEILYNSLRSSLFKGYFEQIIPVSNNINPNNESWGLIITYKEFFFSDFSELFEIGKEKYSFENENIPPENVFIIDIYAWDMLIQTIKEKNITIVEILKKAKLNNKNSNTKKALFTMHLEEYNLENFDLSYLKDELKKLELKKGL